LTAAVSIEVHPDQIASCGRRLDDSGVVWGQGVTTLQSATSDTSAFGSDDVGSALLGLYEPLQPKIVSYAEETGFCVRETGSALVDIADAYRDTEETNTQQAAKVEQILHSIGAS